MTLTLGLSLLGVPPASAASEAVQGVAGVPMPPKSVDIVWDTYTGFTVDHYEVSLTPGSRYREVPAGATSASFGDLGWSVSYTATVIAVDGTGAMSPEADIVLHGTKLTGSIDPGTTRRGRETTVQGALRWRSGTPIANAIIEIRRAYYPEPLPSSKFKEIGTVETNAKGLFSFTSAAVRNAQYRVLYRGQPFTEPTVGGWDSNIDLSVTVPITLRFSPNPVNFGSRVRFSGKVKAPTTYVAGTSLRLQHREDGLWKTAKSGQVLSDGSYAIRYQPRSRGNHAWRVITARSDFFVASASRAKVLSVS